MFSVRKTIFAFIAVFSFAVFTAGHGTAQEKSSIVVCLNHLDSGLRPVQLPATDLLHAEDRHCRELELGTGARIRHRPRHDAKIAELQFVAEGEGVKRFPPVMYNDFVLIGPKSDPARIKGVKDVAKAFRAIKDKQSPFISRGDRSGTHLAELRLWNKDAGIDIEREKGAWYKSISQGMGAACNWHSGCLAAGASR